MGFNVVENNDIRDNLYNFYINDYNSLIKRLEEYVYSVIKLYNLDNNEYEIKKILILLWANITNSEMYNIDNYVKKYIDFINNNSLVDYIGKKEIDNIGFLNYSFKTQSYKQETP